MKTSNIATLSFAVLLGLAAAHAFAAELPVPPKAAKRPYTVPSPHGGRTDEYHWLRDDTRKNPEMLAYLAAENAYREAVLAPTKPAQETLYTEMVARLKQDDASVPERKNGWWYYSRFAEGKEYPIYARKRGSLEAPEEIMLDVNALAEGISYIQVASRAVTVDGRRLAWTQDTVGRRQYSLRFKDLVTGTVLPDQIENIEEGIAWANDNRTLLYVEKDPVTLLGTRVRKHVLGTDPKTDPVVYEEKDNSYYLSVVRSRSDRYLQIQLETTVATECRVADASDPRLEFRVLIPRERDHEYQAEDRGGRWIIRTNWQAKNFRVVEAPAERAADRTVWRDVVPHRADAFVHGFAVFRDHLAVSERLGGLRKIRIKAWADGAEHVIAADEPTYTTALSDNPETATGTLRYSYTSLTTPETIYDYDMAARTRTLRKREPVLGRFDPADYESEFLHAPARDGKRVPVSLVHRKGFRRDGTAALHLRAYGSYGNSTDPTFSSQNLSLLDRGVVIALAHIRGGQELGRAWYEDGKLLKKKNTFTDFIDVTDFLVREGYAAKDRVAAEGGSAGGLLMGAVANMSGEKYRAILAQVPWVDVVSDMLDTSIPLTTNEFDEWGNPADKAYYDYMLSYSPYDNVAARAYPALFVTGGLWDSQVQYYNPAKWVARLRDRKTDDHLLLLRTDMASSHGGKSGRFQRYRDTAEEFAFLFTQWGIPVGGSTAAAAPLTTHQQLARDIFRELIEINTITATGDTALAADAMAARLRAAGLPAADVQVFKPAPKKGNLVARLRGTGARKPIVLMAHLDVVAARREDWSFEPFKLTEQDGFFYGRGTTDVKHMAASFVATLIRLKQEGHRPDRDLILVLETDEEDSSPGGPYGIEWLLKHHRNLLDAEYALNEGGGLGLKDGRPHQMDFQTCEKVYQSYWLEVRNPGGHSSKPTKDNAIYRLATGLTRLAQFDFPVQLNETTRAFFERMATVEKGQVALDMKAVTLPNPDADAVARLSSIPIYNAQLRTTCIATRVEAGHADNALPQTARAMVNCRVLPGESVDAVRATIVRVLADEQISVTPTGEPTLSPPSPLNPEVLQAVEKLTAEFWSGTPVIPVMSTGATDGLFLRNAGIPTYGLDGFGTDLFDVRAHGKDERLPVKSFYEGLEFTYRLVKMLSGGV